MPIKQNIIVPGVPLFFSRNNTVVPEYCPHCLSKNIKWTPVDSTKINADRNGYSSQFDGYKLSCLDCFAEIIYKE